MRPVTKSSKKSRDLILTYVRVSRDHSVVFINPISLFSFSRLNKYTRGRILTFEIGCRLRQKIFPIINNSSHSTWIVQPYCGETQQSTYISHECCELYVSQQVICITSNAHVFKYTRLFRESNFSQRKRDIL